MISVPKMPILCSICKTEFILSSQNVVNIFCKHISKCALRSDNELQARYFCSICQTGFNYNQNFKKHVLKHHIEKGHLPQCSKDVSSDEPSSCFDLGNFIKYKLVIILTYNK